MVPHPLCKDGEDEMQCKQEYIKKRRTYEYANFACESPHHNIDSNTASVTIYATACDGFAECFKDIDELNCEVAIPNYILFGKLLSKLEIFTNDGRKET